jgi:hypothetical protein
MRAVRWLRAGRLVLVLVFGGFLLGPAAVVRAGQAQMLLPDLAMLAPSSFRIEFKDGKKLLRFTTIAVNVGPGPFRVVGSDDDGQAEIGDTLAVRQQIRRSDGTLSSRDTTSTMTWSGDGHNHWHLDDYQKFWIQTVDGAPLEYVHKTGFCAFDSYRYGSTAPPWYTWERYVCRTAANGKVLMGTSRKWGDIYPSTIAFQWIDITGLAAGTYKVYVAVDPRIDLGGKFLESNETNNRSWARVRISGSSVTVLARSTNP